MSDTAHHTDRCLLSVVAYNYVDFTNIETLFTNRSGYEYVVFSSFELLDDLDYIVSFEREHI